MAKPLPHEWNPEPAPEVYTKPSATMYVPSCFLGGYVGFDFAKCLTLLSPDDKTFWEGVWRQYVAPPTS